MLNAKMINSKSELDLISEGAWVKIGEHDGILFRNDKDVQHPTNSMVVIIEKLPTNQIEWKMFYPNTEGKLVFKKKKQIPEDDSAYPTYNQYFNA